MNILLTVSDRCEITFILFWMLKFFHNVEKSEINPIAFFNKA